MRLNTGFSILRGLIVFSLVSLAIPKLCPAEEKSNFKPLFKVKLDQDFPEPHKTFDEVKDLILNNYYSNEITDKALYWAAIEGMLRYISPPDNPELAKLWTPEEYEKILQALEGVQVSIGIKSRFNQQEGSLTVTEVLPNSPASSLLKPFDRILRIDSQSLKDKSVDEVNALLNGEEGTEVTFTVNRDLDIFDLTIRRRQFETQDLIVTRLTDKVIMAEIKRFSIGISGKLRDALNKYKEEGFQGLIIDLRNDTGGVFSEALKVVELFLPEKSILLRTYQRETALQNYVSVNKDPFKADVAVLVNSNTASSSEILAGALQDHQKGIIIGTRTFGKGVFEKTFTLSNGYRVKFITGAMYTPKGHSWQGSGITPDFLVEQDAGTLASLMKLSPKERFQKDVAIITAYKLLTR